MKHHIEELKYKIISPCHCCRLVTAKTEEELVHKKTERLNEEVNLHEFAQILRIDEKEPATQQLFRIHDRVCTTSQIYSSVSKNE